MEGSPRLAAQALVLAREALYGALLALMGHGDIPAAYRETLNAQDFLETLRTGLETLARVNGVNLESDALEGETGTSEVLEEYRLPDGRTLAEGLNGLTMREREAIEAGRMCPRCLSPDPGWVPNVPTVNGEGECTHPWHTPPPPPDPDRKPARTLLANESLAGYAPPRCNDGRCPDHVPCVNHCGTGQCSRCCTVCRRLAGTPSDPCPACPDYVSRCSAGIPLGQLFTGTGKLPRATHRDGSLCLHRIHDDGVLIYDGAMIQHVRDQQQLEIPASDLWVALDKPVVIPGAMTTGEAPQGVTVTHIPTGIWVRSSSERSQLQNRAAALALLCEQQAVVKYVQEHHTPGKRS